MIKNFKFLISNFKCLNANSVIGNCKLDIGNWKFRNGQSLVISLITLAVVLILSASLFSRIANFIRFGSNADLKEQAINLAEAGIDYGLWQLNKTAGAYTGDTNKSLGTTGTFTVTVTDKSSNLKTITATGYIPNSTNPRAKQTIKVDTLTSAQNIAFHYAVQAGTGGVNMQNQALISGTVYSNGNITGSGSSEIDGDAYAVGTISSPDPFVTGSKHPSSPASQMPTVDSNYWESQANINNDPVTCSPTCSFSSGSINLGPKKYVGNLSLSNSVVATLNGPLYITGNLTLSNSAQINLNNSFGSNGTVIIVDGTITTQNNSQFNFTNASPPGLILVVSTSSSNTAVSISNSGQTAIFYTLNGGAVISNQANVEALVAKSLTMKNQSELQYQSGLASAEFSSGPGGSWQPKKGTYRFSASP